MPFLLVRIRGEWFAIPLLEVQAVVPIGRITRVPHAPRGVKGIVDWQGKVWTLYDLGEWFDLPGPLTSTPYMILLELKRLDMEVGFIAEEVREVREITPASLETAADKRIALADLQVRVLDGERFFAHLATSALPVVSHP